MSAVAEDVKFFVNGSEGSTCSGESDRFTIFDSDTVIQAVGVNRYQIIISIICCLLFFEFSSEVLMCALVTESVWNEWPEYAGTMKYNGLYFGSTVGALLGTVIFCPAIDIFGRKWVLLSCLAGDITFSLISVFSVSFPMFAVCQSITSFFVNGMGASGFIYLIECLPVRRRALLSTFVTICGSLGCAYSVGLQWWLTDFRYVVGLSLLPAVCVCLPLLAWKGRETARWYISEGNETKAWDEFAAGCPGGREELARRLGVDSLEHCRLAVGDEPLPSRHRNLVYRLFIEPLIRMKDVMVSRVDMRNTISMSFVWFLQAFGYWGIISYLPLYLQAINIDSDWSMMLGYIVGMPLTMASYFTAEGPLPWLGRIRSLQYFVVATVILLAVLTACVGCDYSGWFLYIPGLLLIGAPVPIWNILNFYTPELFSTANRGAAMAVIGVMGLLPQFLTFPIGLTALQSDKTWIYSLIWCFIYMLVLIPIFFVKREMFDTPLTDV